MKAFAWILLLLAAPVFHGFIVRPAAPSKLSLAPRRFAYQFTETEFSLDELTSEVEAALKVAQRALEEENKKHRQEPTLVKTEFDSSSLEAEIENALLAVNQAILRVEQETFAAKDDADLIDADKILGERSNDVVKWLSQGFLDSKSFESYAKQREEEDRLLRQRQAQKAREFMLQMEEKACRLKEEIRSAGVRRRKLERLKSANLIGLDGSLVGSGLGLYAWHAIPEVLGDNIPPFVPVFLGGGIVGCAFIVAATSETPLGNFLQNSPLGQFSRILLLAMSFLSKTTGMAVTTAAGTVANTVASKAKDVSDATNERIQHGTEFMNDKQSDRSSIANGLDGSIIGGVLVFCAWHNFPEFFGDKIPPVVPIIVGGGIVGCACIVAATSETPLGNALQKSPLGQFSRILLLAVTSFTKATKAVVDNVTRGVTSTSKKVSDAIAESIQEGTEFMNDKQSDRSSIANGLDGSIIGGALGFYVWHVFPEFFGDRISPVVPVILSGGIMGCSCIVAATSETPLANVLQNSPLGQFSRIVLFVMTSLSRAPGTTMTAASKSAEMNEEQSETTEY